MPEGSTMKLQGRVYDDTGVLRFAEIEVQDGRISRVDFQATAKPTVVESSPILAPGFIDIHVHGGGGADTMDATEAAFEQIATTHAKFGTTSLLLTTVTETPEAIAHVLEAAKRYQANPGPGANVVGVHLEGPFLNPAKAGAQRADLMRDPAVELTQQWLTSGLVRLITIAPELPGALAVARLARDGGVVVSAGHTNATFNQMAIAHQAGFSHVTHLCNAMPPLLHREAGPIGYAIDNEHMTGDLICDNIHLTAPMVKALVRAIGTERLILITDAMRAANMPDGEYDLGGLAVRLQNGACRLLDGTLAGSVLTMSEAVTQAAKLGGISRREAIAMASRNPADKLRLQRKGRIEVGCDADIVGIGESSGQIIWTMVGGRIVYQR